MARKTEQKTTLRGKSHMRVEIVDAMRGLHKSALSATPN